MLSSQDMGFADELEMHKYISGSRLALIAKQAMP